MLCEPSSYIWNVLVYWDFMNLMPGLAHEETVVMALIDKLLNKGHMLYTVNCYTCVSLVNKLLENKTKLCGTL